MKATLDKPIRVYVQIKDGVRRSDTESFTLYGVTIQEAKRLFLSALNKKPRKRKAS